MDSDTSASSSGEAAQGAEQDKAAPPKLRPVYSARDFNGALGEIIHGLMGHKIYWTLALSEVRTRYRRSFLGPFWMTFASAVTILGLGLLWSQLWKVDLAEYFPYLAAGMITWNYIAGVLTSASDVFLNWFFFCINCRF